MLKKSIVLIVLAITMSGCYHAQVTTGLEASNEVYQQKWATSLIGGLVPPSLVDATEHCSNGVAKVETRHSFLNMIAQAITFSIYSPMEITVTCATGMGSLETDNEPIELAANSSEDVKVEAYNEAISIAAKTNKPVYLELK